MTKPLVGPVLTAGRMADAIVSAILAANPQAKIIDRGSYIRILVESRCQIGREAIEKSLGESINLREDLELVMPSFKGKMSMTDDEVVWE